MFTRADLQAVEQLRRVLQLYAAGLPGEQAREVATVYPRWQAGAAYQAGEYVTCGTDRNGDPVLYKVVQAHTSQEDWPPAGTPALYSCVSLSGGHCVWSQPTGAHDAYNKGDVVEYNGVLYRSTIDGNVWAPDVYPQGWETYEEVSGDA